MVKVPPFLVAIVDLHCEPLQGLRDHLGGFCFAFWSNDLSWKSLAILIRKVMMNHDEPLNSWVPIMNHWILGYPVFGSIPRGGLPFSLPGFLASVRWLSLLAVACLSCSASDAGVAGDNASQLQNSLQPEVRLAKGGFLRLSMDWMIGWHIRIVVWVSWVTVRKSGPPQFQWMIVRMRLTI